MKSAMRRMAFNLVLVFVAFLTASPVTAASSEERFPAPEFRSGYQLPQTRTSAAAAAAWGYLDVAVLAGALSLAAYLVYRKRSRRGVFLLTVFCLAYFGFYRKGCICPIGSIQNVALAMGTASYALPWTVAAIFLLPLLFALFFGRVFCAAVCPLGAIQDVFLFKSVRLPAWLEQSLGLLPHVYLGIAVLIAAVGSDFIVCRYDPFVSFFRLSGPAHILFYGGVLLAIGIIIGRPYCRFLCPYGVLLRYLSPIAKHRVTITPSECVDCRLCEQACPFGAIRHPIPPQPPPRGGAARRAKRQLAIVIVCLPLFVAVFAVFGRLAGPALSRFDFNVELARQLWSEEHGGAATEETKAFHATAQPAEQAYRRSDEIGRKFNIGSSFLGAYVGIVIGVKLVRLSIRRRRPGYTADPGACVACARCYASCPVEQERAQKLVAARAEREELVTV